MIRALAHLFGWHTNACRGDRRCWSPVMKRGRHGWWRNVTSPPGQHPADHTPRAEQGGES